MALYGIPHTSEWVDAIRLSTTMKEKGFIPINSLPPKLSAEAKISGKIHVVTESGEWDIVDDPLYISKMDSFIKKIFNTNVITKAMYKRLSEKLLEISEQK